MTVSEVVANSNRSCAQEIVDKVAEWSTQNRGIESYRIYLINRPGRLLNFWTLRVGTYSRWALFEAGCLLNFHHIQQVKYVYFATKQ